MKFSKHRLFGDEFKSAFKIEHIILGAVIEVVSYDFNRK